MDAAVSAWQLSENELEMGNGLQRVDIERKVLWL